MKGKSLTVCLYDVLLKGGRWGEYLKAGTWQLETDAFWTYPHVFSEMSSTDPQLYTTLGAARLVIFKGDLNYRKLVGDRNWETVVPFGTALQVNNSK